MTSGLPFFAQERIDTCAIACLRTILAATGRHVSEEELVQASGMETGGLSPEQLAVLARQYGLKAKEEQFQLVDLRARVEARQFSITYLYRLPLDGVKEIHAVIPFRFTAQYVHVLDPLRGERRISQRKFQEARRWVDYWCVDLAASTT